MLMLFGQKRTNSTSVGVIQELERILDRMFDPLYLYSGLRMPISAAINESAGAESGYPVSVVLGQAIVSYLIVRGYKPMITEIPQNLAIGLLFATLLAVVMGYVIASIRSTRRADFDVHSMKSELARVRVDAEAELRLVLSEKTEFQTSLNLANERVTSAKNKEESLELHMQFLSQRIQSLESQVSSYEEQQIRLQRDFATYKSNKARELELARVKPETWSTPGHLPVLNKRIPQDESLMSRSFPASQARDFENLERHGSPNRALSPTRTPSPTRSHTKLSLPLSQELDIPTLAESELPASLEDLEFELMDFDIDGGNSRG